MVTPLDPPSLSIKSSRLVRPATALGFSSNSNTPSPAETVTQPVTPKRGAEQKLRRMAARLKQRANTLPASDPVRRDAHKLARAVRGRAQEAATSPIQRDEFVETVGRVKAQTATVQESRIGLLVGKLSKLMTPGTGLPSKLNGHTAQAVGFIQDMQSTDAKRKQQGIVGAQTLLDERRLSYQFRTYKPILNGRMPDAVAAKKLFRDDSIDKQREGVKQAKQLESELATAKALQDLVEATEKPLGARHNDADTIRHQLLGHGRYKAMPAEERREALRAGQRILLTHTLDTLKAGAGSDGQFSRRIEALTRLVDNDQASSGKLERALKAAKKLLKRQGPSMGATVTLPLQTPDPNATAAFTQTPAPARTPDMSMLPGVGTTGFWDANATGSQFGPAPNIPLGRTVAVASPQMITGDTVTNATQETLMGNYRVAGKLGEGAMGEVYAATHDMMGRQVALKVKIPKKRSTADQDDTDARAHNYFLNEIRIAGILSGHGQDSYHPNVVLGFDAGHLPDGRPYLATEMIEGGRNLAQLIAAGDPMIRGKKAKPVTIAAQLANAMAFVHSKNVVHRDIKAANVLVTQTGAAKLGDFGLSYALQADTPETNAGRVGTPDTMAPEQWQGVASKKADVYSLGCTLYQLFTGETVFKATSKKPIEQFMEIESAHKSQQPPQLTAKNAPHLSWRTRSRLNKLLMSMLAKDPDKRPSAQAVNAELEKISGAKRRITPVHVAIGTLVAAFAGGGGTAAVMYSSNTPNAPTTGVHGKLEPSKPVIPSARSQFDVLPLIADPSLSDNERMYKIALKTEELVNAHFDKGFQSTLRSRETTHKGKPIRYLAANRTAIPPKAAQLFNPAGVFETVTVQYPGRATTVPAGMVGISSLDDPEIPVTRVIFNFGYTDKKTKAQITTGVHSLYTYIGPDGRPQAYTEHVTYNVNADQTSADPNTRSAYGVRRPNPKEVEAFIEMIQQTQEGN